MMNSYKIVLLGASPDLQRSGYVFCASDEQARAAARALLQFHLEHSAVYAYDGERLVCEILRETRRASAAD